MKKSLFCKNCKRFFSFEVSDDEKLTCPICNNPFVEEKKLEVKKEERVVSFFCINCSQMVNTVEKNENGVPICPVCNKPKGSINLSVTNTVTGFTKQNSALGTNRYSKFDSNEELLEEFGEEQITKRIGKGDSDLSKILLYYAFGEKNFSILMSVITQIATKMKKTETLKNVLGGC